MQLLSCFQMMIKVLGCYVNHPIYILSGLAQHHAILGVDFVREQHFSIEADHVFFCIFSLKESVSYSCFTAPHTVSHLSLIHI